jgi:hypothetical protein
MKMTPDRFAKLVETLHRAEADMRRTFNRWEKIRGQVRRAEKLLDRDFARRGTATVDEGGLAVPGAGDEPRSCAGADFNDDLPESRG